MREKGRAAVYGMGAFYLLYLAYEIFGARMDNGGKDYVMMIIFSVVFVIAGAALLTAAVIMFKNMAKADADAEKQEEQGKEDLSSSEKEDSLNERNE